ncbi:hypothetical protein [Streptomyces sp. NPDC054784]
MHGTTTRRTVATTAAVAVLALAAACGSGGDRDRADASARPEPTRDTGGHGTGGGGGGGDRTGADAPPLTRAQLDGALLDPGDVAGWTARRDTADALPARHTLTPDRPACEPLTDTVDSAPRHPRTAYTSGLLTPDTPGTAPGDAVQQVLLASYGPGEAAAWLGELARALDDCRAFRATTGTGEGTRLEITPGRPIGVGDDAVRFTMRDARGRDAPTVVTVVRAGGSTATFLSVGVTGDPAPVPETVVEGQWRKLTGAARP